MKSFFLAGFHTMLPKSSESASGAISMWQWVKMGWNYKSTPAFNPLQVFLLTFTSLPGIFDIGEGGVKPQIISTTSRHYRF